MSEENSHQATSDKSRENAAAIDTLARLIDGWADRVQGLERQVAQIALGDIEHARRLKYIEALLNGPRFSSDITDVGKSKPPEPKSHEPIEKRAVRLTVELAQVLRDLNASEDESDCRLKEGVVEAIERAAGLEVG